jgi:hypothetical protein
MAATRTQRLRLDDARALAAGVATAPAAPVARAPPATGVTREVVGNSTLPAPIRGSFADGGLGPMGPGRGDDRGGTEVRNVQIAKFVAESGGQVGWHQHSGPIWVAVTAGTLTLCSGEDPRCPGAPYPAGTAFRDPGNRTNFARNERDAPVELYAVYLLPEGGAPCIDAPAPGTCPF